MDKIDEKKSIKKELKRKKKALVNYHWIVTITLSAFLISLLFSSLSEITIPKVPTVIGIMILLAVIVLGIVFDVIGVAVQAADEKPFHSMNARKIKGAKTAIYFKKNADKVSSFCNDVIGDICGVISGSTSSILALSISTSLHSNQFITVLLITGVISALTIGGKAIGKSYAINKSNEILYRFARCLSHFM